MQYLFLNYFQIPPTQATFYITLTNLPWSPKIFYGIITDCLPICGSGKRSYVFIMGMFQGLSCLAVVLFQFQNAFWVMLMMMFNSLGGAFMDVVVDGLMVINSKKDPTEGSEDLQSWSWMFYGIGGVVGCSAAGYFLSGQDANGDPAGQPMVCFSIMAVFGCAVGISGLFIDPSLEENQKELIEMGLCRRTAFVFREVCQGLRMKEIYSSLIYQLLLGALVPWFGTYLYYYQLTHGFTQWEYSALQVIGYATLISGSFVFNTLKEKEFTFMMICACLLNCFGAVMTMFFCRGFTFGIPKFLFVILTSTVCDTLY